jgi:hypothetical protein
MIFHEGGHWLAFRFFGFKNAIIRWSIFQDTEIGLETHKKLNITKAIVIGWSGIFAGLFPIYVFGMFVDSSVLSFILMCYIMLCFGDFNLLFQIMGSKDWDMTLYEFNVEEWKKYKRFQDGAG